VNNFVPHWEVLPPEQREIWPQLVASSSMGFVLYGGTAVALRMGHRTSVDFDFFTERPLGRKNQKADLGPITFGATTPTGELRSAQFLACISEPSRDPADCRRDRAVYSRRVFPGAFAAQHVHLD
jgi:hypothetical protein